MGYSVFDASGTKVAGDENLDEAPTDYERETLIDVMVMTKLSDYATTDMSAIHQAVDAILAAGFRRPARTEPTDAQVLAAALEINRAGWTYEGAHEPGCLADGCDECAEACLPVARSALKAAFAAGQEEQS